MRTVQLGDKEVTLRATPITLILYKQAFKRDLTGDLLKMVQGMVGMQALSGNIDMDSLDLGAIDSVVFLQIAWAMARADAYGSQFPDFETWIHELGAFNVMDRDLMGAVISEAVDGFFRNGAAGRVAQTRRAIK